MPTRITTNSTSYNVGLNPFVGAVGHTHALAVPMGALTTAEVDANGYLKPGVPLSAAGALVGAATAVFGVTLEAIKVALTNAAGDLTAAGTVEVAVGTIGQVNRKIMEDNLGRVLTANEIAGFAVAPCTIKLLA